VIEPWPRTVPSIAPATAALPQSAMRLLQRRRPRLVRRRELQRARASRSAAEGVGGSGQHGGSCRATLDSSLTAGGGGAGASAFGCAEAETGTSPRSATTEIDSGRAIGRYSHHFTRARCDKPELGAFAQCLSEPVDISSMIFLTALMLADVTARR
jgi:hypothetical protein